MSQNIPLAVSLVIVGSFCFALSAHFQHYAVDRHLEGNAAKQRMTVAAFLQTVRSKRWLLGLVLLGASFLLQVAALFMAPVSVVQPVGLLAFPWSILLAAWASKTPVPPPVQWAVGVTVASTLAFTVVTSVHAVDASDLIIRRVVVGALVVYGVAALFAFLGSHGPYSWRSLFWSSGGALFYGLEAALVKSLIEYARTHTWPFHPEVYFIVAGLIAGALVAGWLIQQGYATGAPEIVVGSMTVTSPVVAVAFGFLVLGEGARITFPIAVLMIALGAVAISGVVALTRFHPTYAHTAPEIIGDSDSEAVAVTSDAEASEVDDVS